MKGYKPYSHVACISFLRTLYFGEDVIEKVCSLRMKRHRSKYYGIHADKTESEELFRSGMRIFDGLRAYLKKELNANKM